VSLLVVLLSIFSGANAVVRINDIVPSRIAFEPNSLGYMRIFLENTGSGDEYLFVDYYVAGATYRDFWHIEPSTERSFDLFLQAPSEEGIYDVTVVAENKRHRAQAGFEMTVAPTEFNFVVDLEPDYSSVDAGQEMELDLAIANVGTEKDVYGIKVGEKVKIEKNSVKLDGESIVHIPVTYMTSELDEVGGKDIEIEVCSLSDMEDIVCRTASATVVVTKPETLQSIIIFTQQNITTYSGSAEFLLGIQNIGIDDKSYLIEISTDENTTVIVEPDIFSLSPEESQEVLISATSDEPGLHTINVKAYANGMLISNTNLNMMFLPSGVTGAFVAVFTNPWLYGILALVLISIVVIYLVLPRGNEYPY
jgi:hypothetical protein